MVTFAPLCRLSGVHAYTVTLPWSHMREAQETPVGTDTPARGNHGDSSLPPRGTETPDLESPVRPDSDPWEHPEPPGDSHISSGTALRGHPPALWGQPQPRSRRHPRRGFPGQGDTPSPPEAAPARTPEPAGHRYRCRCPGCCSIAARPGPSLGTRGWHGGRGCHAGDMLRTQR